MIKITVSVSILILLILFIRKCFYYQISRKLQYALWLFVPLYLVFAPLVNIKIPVCNIRLPVINKNKDQYQKKQKEINTVKNIYKDQNGQNKLYSFFITNGRYTQNNINKGKTSIKSQEKRINILTCTAKVSKILYYIITAAIIFLIITKNTIFISYCIKNRRYYKTDSQTGIKIYILEHAATPFLLGKCIYISSENAGQKQHLKYIILHEYCHLKHMDALWGIVKCIIKTFLWFNPFIWLASRYEEYDCELACDEAVIQISGKDGIQHYGNTLLYIALKQAKNNRNIIISAIGGKKNMLKERILYIISKKKNKKTVAVMAALAICTMSVALFVLFTDKPGAGAMENNKILSGLNTVPGTDNKNIKTQYKEEKEGFPENNNYNGMKSDGKYIYFAGNNGLYRTNIKTGTNNKIADGSFWLGDITDKYLYYAKTMPEDLNTTEKGVVITGRILLKDLSEETIYKEESTNYMGFAPLYTTNDNTVYTREGIGTINNCHKYVLNNSTNKWEKKSISPYTNKIKNMPENLSGNLYLFGSSNYIKNITKEEIFFIEKFFPEKPANSSLLMVNDSGEILKELNNYYSGFMLTDNGFLYTDKEFNIHLCSYEKPYNDNIIFKPGKNFSYINYGVYDKNGIYGFHNNKNGQTEIARLSWDGKITVLYTSEKTPPKDLYALSAFGDSIAFFEKGKFKLINY